MAITKVKKDNLVETEIGTNKVSDIKREKKKSEYDLDIDSTSEPKKKGFLATTIDELKKVEWPGAGYVAKWSLIIILFTAFVSVFLGFFDIAFSQGIEFVNCTSPQSRNQSIQDCTTEFVEGFRF